MFKHFRDYYWKDGKPCGLDVVDPAGAPQSYKIVSDPYFKWISVERYHYLKFDQTVYDSLQLNFRRLTETEQTAWQREILSEGEDQVTALLRNQDDRAILFETMYFEAEKCRKCVTTSIQGLLICTHRMFYRSCQDTFDGVILYDREEKIVMTKSYSCDPETGEFATLLNEEWDGTALSHTPLSH
jgi:hypothetical protein